MTDPMRYANDPKVRDACQERCAGFGDPPCYELAATGQIDVFEPCRDCLADAGIILDEPRDDNAAVGDLFS